MVSFKKSYFFAVVMVVGLVSNLLAVKSDFPGIRTRRMKAYQKEVLSFDDSKRRLVAALALCDLEYGAPVEFR